MLTTDIGFPKHTSVAQHLKARKKMWKRKISSSLMLSKRKVSLPAKPDQQVGQRQDNTQLNKNASYRGTDLHLDKQPHRLYVQQDD